MDATECYIYNNRDERDEFWTLQQFTGMRDKNGKDIYEGDWLEFAYREDGAIFVGEVLYSEKFACFITRVGNAFETFNDLTEYAGSFKVVGNIFENETKPNE